MNQCKTESCVRRVRAWGLCEACYRKEVYHGRIVPQKQKHIAQRFTENTNTECENGCWEWAGLTDRDGYGRMKRNSKSTLAHRLSYELYKGVIPDDKMVCHTCDNPRCVNPEHLYIGDAKTNRQDCVSRGRTNQGRDKDGKFAKNT